MRKISVSSNTFPEITTGKVGFPRGEPLGNAEAGIFYRLDALRVVQPTVSKHCVVVSGMQLKIA